jgi:carbamoylphosphate synthase small subunit
VVAVASDAKTVKMKFGHHGANDARSIVFNHPKKTPSLGLGAQKRTF